MIKIIADSSCDITSLDKEYPNISFSRVPLRITVDGVNYVDTEELDVSIMMQHVETFKGKTASACPSPSAWLEASQDADTIFMVTLSSGMSGSYNSALVAQKMIEEENPEKKVYVVDSLAASGKNALIVYKLAEYIAKGMSFLDVCVKIENYKSKLALNFLLFSIDNLIKNGRVGKLTGMAASALNIVLIGVASEEGTLKPLNKARGLSKTIATLVSSMKANGYRKGKVIISHSFNELGAIKLKEAIQKEFGSDKISIVKCSGLCSYYSERNGLLVGYEI